MLTRRLACIATVALSCLLLSGCISGNRTLDHQVTVAGLIFKIPSSWEESTTQGAGAGHDAEGTRFTSPDGSEWLEVSYTSGYYQAVDAHRYMLSWQHADEEAGLERSWEVTREAKIDEWQCNVYRVTEPIEGEEATYEKAVVYGPTAVYEIDLHSSSTTMELLMKTMGFEEGESSPEAAPLP